MQSATVRNGMLITSVNLSDVREIEVEGRRIRTGMFKSPVQGPVAVASENLAGDAQADLVNHGGSAKAVYAFSADQYPHWQNELAREDMQPGFFGENLTVAGLDESLIAVGDRCRAGSVVLEVSQPRVPCFKLGIRTQDPGFPRRFIAHARPGIYLRVLSVGELQMGDRFELEQASASQDDADRAITNLFRAVYDKQLPREERLRVIGKNIDLSALSDEWGDLLWKTRNTLSRD